MSSCVYVPARLRVFPVIRVFAIRMCLRAVIDPSNCATVQGRDPAR